jgi:4-hydroxythreonine-4-phosphate dehydrogenase
MAGSPAGPHRGGRPRLGLTLGDPSGVGPELVLRALSDPSVSECCDATVYGDAALLARVAQVSGVAWPAGLAPERVRQADRGAGTDLSTIAPGRVQAAAGRLALGWIEAAVRGALAGEIDGIVTGPVNTAALHLAGCHFPGHTEMLASLAGARATAMMFWSPRLVVTLATIHAALADVPRLLTAEAVGNAIRLTARALAHPGGPSPRIGVLALNPHAGEGGLFGDEETRIVAPAIAAARAAEGIDAHGPLVPDTAFVWLGAGTPAPFDAWVALYHDQGLIPFKAAAFDQGVNVTLGLPFVRTSPDHGTAFDLAWKGTASPASFISAIRCAARLAVRQPDVTARRAR